MCIDEVFRMTRETHNATHAHEREYILRHSMSTSDFSEHLCLLAEPEIIEGFKALHSMCDAGIARILEDDTVHIFAALKVWDGFKWEFETNNALNWDFKNNFATKILDIVRVKYEGEAKYQATPDQQRLLIEFGILTSKDSEKVSPRVLDSLLELDLGL